jgi:hypothetical protein
MAALQWQAGPIWHASCQQQGHHSRHYCCCCCCLLPLCLQHTACHTHVGQGPVLPSLLHSNAWCLRTAAPSAAQSRRVGRTCAAAAAAAAVVLLSLEAVVQEAHQGAAGLECCAYSDDQARGTVF